MDDFVDDYTFTLFNTLLQQRCGLHFRPATRIDLELGLQQAMQEAAIHNLLEYYHLLEKLPTDSPLWKQLIAHLTIGETYFFRDHNQFRALREIILPALIEERRQQQLHILRIWSAGCASGEEAYSLAILLHELIEDIDQWHITINATDINDHLLEKARQGRYGVWSFRMETPDTIKERYFQPQADHSYTILPELRQMVTYRYLNLVEDSYPSVATDTSNIDLLLCRNVTIYFDRSTTQQIVDRFYDALAPGGWLLVGHSEPLPSIYQAYETHYIASAICYRKREQEAPSYAPLPPAGYALPLSSPAQSQYNRKAEAAPPRSLAEVELLITKGAAAEARHLLEEILDHVPQHVEAWCLLARLAVDEGRLEGVHDILDHVDQIDPLVPQAHYLRALVFQQQNAWLDAKSALRRALYADRNFALAHYMMGELLYHEGSLALARKSWRNAAALLDSGAPHNPLPYGDGLTQGSLLHAIEQRLAVT